MRILRLLVIFAGLGFIAAIGWSVAPLYEAALRHFDVRPSPIFAPPNRRKAPHPAPVTGGRKA